MTESKAAVEAADRNSNGGPDKMTTSSTDIDTPTRDSGAKSVHSSPIAADDPPSSTSPKKRRKVNHGEILQSPDSIFGNVSTYTKSLNSVCLLSTFGELQLFSNWTPPSAPAVDLLHDIILCILKLTDRNGNGQHMTCDSVRLLLSSTSASRYYRS